MILVMSLTSALHVWCQHDGKFDRPASPGDRVRDIACAVDEAHVFDDLEERLDDDAPFEAGEERPRADVSSGAERHVVPGPIALQVEVVRMLERGGITVGGLDAHEDRLVR